MRRLEVWADSYKEGEWFITAVADFAGAEYTIDYIHNFQPRFRFSKPHKFEAVVYGDYRSWNPLPNAVSSIIDYGKPDIMLYDRSRDRVILGIEETAAVPTGNQALQRLERVVYSAQSSVPFIYLIAEYGLHKDGGVRRTSIWPSYLALKLTGHYGVPSLTLLYGDSGHPEDYEYGEGVEYMAELGWLFVLDWLGTDVRPEKKAAYTKAYAEMADFIIDHAGDISPRMPGREVLGTKEFAEYVGEEAAKYEV